MKKIFISPQMEELDLSTVESLLAYSIADQINVDVNETSEEIDAGDALVPAFGSEGDLW